MKLESITLNAGRNVTLTAYLLEVGGEFRNIPKRPAVLVLPGGGYSMCSDREADPVALAYLQAGFQAFILRYSVGEGTTWPTPLEDYEQAMELLRAAQEKLAAQYGDTAFGAESSAFSGMGTKMTLRAALTYGNTPSEQVEQLDAALRQIPNP